MQLTAPVQAATALTVSGLIMLSLLLLLMPPLFPEHSMQIEHWYRYPTTSQQGSPSDWVLPTPPARGYAMAEAVIPPLVAADYPLLRVYIEAARSCRTSR